MLLDTGFLIRHPVQVALAVTLVILLKGALAGVAAWLSGSTLRVAVLSGLALAQVGEFSFILARVGQSNGLWRTGCSRCFLACRGQYGRHAPDAGRVGTRRRPAGPVRCRARPARPGSGHHLARSVAGPPRHRRLRHQRTQRRRGGEAGGDPYIVTELNPDTVRREQAAGEPIIFGDASQELVLEHAQVQAARVVVVAINDPAATRTG